MDSGRVSIGNDTNRQHVGRLLIVVRTATNRVTDATIPPVAEHVVYAGTRSVPINENDVVELYFKPYEAPQIGYINLLTRVGLPQSMVLRELVQRARTDDALRGYLFYHHNEYLSINERTIQQFVKCDSNRAGSCYVFRECPETRVGSSLEGSVTQPLGFIYGHSTISVPPSSSHLL